MSVEGWNSLAFIVMVLAYAVYKIVEVRSR